MRLLNRAAYIPLRVRLTVVLVLLAVAVSALVGISSYRLLHRSLEREALDRLNSAATTLSGTVSKTLKFKQDRLQSELKAVELGCGVSGVMAPQCAAETVRKFLRTEHGRAAQLMYGKNGKITVGTFTEAGLSGDLRPTFLVDASGRATYSLRASDPESGLAMEVEFEAQDLATNTGAREAAELIAGTADRVALIGEGLGRPEFILRSSNLANCLRGIPSSGSLVDLDRTKYFVAFVPSGAGRNICAAAMIPQSVVLAPANRWRKDIPVLGLVAVLAGILLAWLVALVLSRPLTILRRRVRNFKNGDFDSPVPIVGSGEILELSEALAQMLASVNTSRAALQESESRLRLAYKAARLWMWEHNLESGSIQWRNPKGNLASAQRRSFRRLLRDVHPEDRHALCDAVRTALMTGSFEAEYRQIEDSGANLWISSWGMVTESRPGKPRMMVGVSLDITARKQAEAIVIEQKKHLATAEMAATLAHEINNPLTSVIGAIYMAKGAKDLPSDAQKFLAIAQEEARRVAQIGRQILSLYRKPGAAEIIDLKYLWDELLTSYGEELRAKRLRIDKNFEAGRIFGFREELRNAFASLLASAIASAQEGSSLRLRVRNSRSYVKLGERGVRIVIATRRAEVLAEAVAQRVDALAGRRASDAGLGVWSTRAAVLKHGGRISVRVGRAGTCVSVYLPARCVAAAAS